MGNFCQKGKEEQFEVVKEGDKIEETEHPIRAVNTKENVENPENEENDENQECECQEEEQEQEQDQDQEEEQEQEQDQEQEQECQEQVCEYHEREQEVENHELETQKHQIQEIKYSPVKSLNEDAEPKNSEQPMEFQQQQYEVLPQINQEVQYAKASSPMQIEQSIQEDLKKITESYGKLGQNIVFQQGSPVQNLSLPDELPVNLLQAIQQDPNIINTPHFDQYFKVEQQQQQVPQTVPKEFPQQYQALENVQIQETNQSIQMTQIPPQNSALPPEIEAEINREINSHYMHSSIPLVQYQNAPSAFQYQEINSNVYGGFEPMQVINNSNMNIPITATQITTGIPMDTNIVGSQVTFGSNSFNGMNMGFF